MIHPRIKSGVPTGPGSKIPAMPETINRTPTSCEIARLLAIFPGSYTAGTEGFASPTPPAGSLLASEECNFPSVRVASHGSIPRLSHGGTGVQLYALGRLPGR